MTMEVKDQKKEIITDLHGIKDQNSEKDLVLNENKERVVWDHPGSDPIMRLSINLTSDEARIIVNSKNLSKEDKCEKNYRIMIKIDEDDEKMSNQDMMSYHASLSWI